MEKIVTESLSLKWGTLKTWNIESEKALDLMNRYHMLGTSMSAMMQRDTPEQKQIICDLIDALDCDSVYLDWDGKHVSKDEAKKYVIEYTVPPQREQNHTRESDG
jgi:hypothetical protein